MSGTEGNMNADEHTNLGEPCEHCKHRFPYDECVVCGDSWPCETVRLRDENERLRAAIGKAWQQ